MELSPRAGLGAAPAGPAPPLPRFVAEMRAAGFQLRFDDPDFLAATRVLAELERRRLHLDLGFSSTFVFCTEHLGLTKGSAFRRTTAARLLSRFPIVADYFADGLLNLTTLVELRDVLSEERLAELLDRASGRSEDEVKMLVAALRPRPEPADLLRRCPRSPQSQDPQRGSRAGPARVSPHRGGRPDEEAPRRRQTSPDRRTGGSGARRSLAA